MKRLSFLSLLFILIFAAIIRLYGLNWDQGFHLHPDERAIAMLTLPLHFPSSIAEFLSPESPLNPHFFAYGNFPLYLLKGTAVSLSIFDTSLDSYDKINLVGRTLSVIADLGTIIILYGIGRKIFNKTVGIISSLFYSISVLPIQLAHFYAVDSLLTFFVMLTLFRLIVFYEKSTIKNSILVGLSFGLALVTKVSALPLVFAILAAICADFALVFVKRPHKIHVWFPHVPKFLRKLFTEGVLIIFITVITFTVLQPYAIIDFKEFLRQTEAQSQMTRNAFTFPYTLQYVGKIPYFYELKNIFFYGQGPVLVSFSFIGFFYFLAGIFQKGKKSSISKEIIILSFFLVYFIIVGRFAVGWMRYMLPLYPLLSLFAALLALQIYKKISPYLNFKFPIGLLVVLVFIGSILVWPLSFMHIYTKPNTRVLASEWINENIPHGKTLAIEHWDDGLPLFGQQNYRILTLELYNPDASEKWKIINDQLSETDYIIIASNRLYVPLMKLTKCEKLPHGRCYTQTAKYYKSLFDGSLGFKKVAEFSTYPALEIGNWKLEIKDSSADESFTVYDHPKVMIFKKSENDT